MTSNPPSLDNRTFEDIVKQIEELARSYLENRWIIATGIGAIRNYKPEQLTLPQHNKNQSGSN